MNNAHSSPQQLTDSALIDEVTRLSHRERHATADLLRALMEFDARRLYLGQGYPSLFAYCTKVLNYAEHAALNRIEVARAARRFPALLECVANGTVSLTGARVLAPHLTDDNCAAVLLTARHKSKREIEELIASLHPRPAVAATVRKLPVPANPSAAIAAREETEPPATDRRSPAQTIAAPAPSTKPVMAPTARPTPTNQKTRAAIEPLAPERYKVQFTITRETRDKLREVQDLMPHSVSNGDLADIFERALTLLCEHLHRQRFAATTQPRSAKPSNRHSRDIPAAVQRAVWQRDGGRCAFVGARGRCGERGFLEYHHVLPFAAGGRSTVDNIELRCRAHNQYEATLFFGPAIARELHDTWDNV